MTTEQPPKRRSHKLRNVLILAAVAIVAIVIGVVSASGGGGGGQVAAPPPAAPAPAPEPNEPAGSTVVYSVEGSGSGMVTYSKADLNIAQETQASLPWTKTVRMDTGLFGSPMTLSATNGMGASGEISCTITVDGQVVSENTSSGQYATVTCSSDGM